MDANKSYPRGTRKRAETRALPTRENEEGKAGSKRYASRGTRDGRGEVQVRGVLRAKLASINQMRSGVSRGALPTRGYPAGTAR